MSPNGPRWRGFYFITDSNLTVNGVVEDSRLALEAGVAMLQYREKSRHDIDRVLKEATAIRDLCRAANVPFIVNDDIRLALDIEADGVHVGQQDSPCAQARKQLGTKAIVGVSVANIGDVDRALADGADYVAVSPVFGTPTKTDAGPGLGLSRLSEIAEYTAAPVAAIGGINLSNIAEVVAAGADLVCAISASLKDGKVAENIRAIRRHLDR